jgi:hypothetical protein
MGKMDTVTVNEPEGDVVDWDAVDWRAVEDEVRRLGSGSSRRRRRGPEARPQSAEVDAPFPRERSAERAAGISTERHVHNHTRPLAALATPRARRVTELNHKPRRLRCLLLSPTHQSFSGQRAQISDPIRPRAEGAG